MSLLSRLAVTAARAYGMLVAGSSTNVSASYLAVAGGGGGGGIITNGSGGGGGAGGYLTSSFTLSTLNTYSITVGAGGTASVSGSNSIVSGTGLTTVTSTGGGAGAEVSGNSAAIGGSGGGGSGQTGGTSAGAAGTSGQGNAGGTGGLVGANRGGGGGGGASAVGSNQNGGTGQAGAGGAGSASSISGSSVTYAGGGGGGGNSGGAGGAGGGANGASAGTSPALSGTVNTGGGGGGGDQTSATRYGGSGGSGVVIISYTSATPKFVGGTLTTSGGNQIHTFTSSGTLSPLTPVTASYLVVAGGAGGGGGFDGGGGGAGGLLTSSTTIYSGATYVVTVGAGGAGGVTATGTSGVASSISGTGLTTITSTGGGGGGGGGGAVGLTGGSGGGGSRGNAGGTGTSGQGFAGGAGIASTPTVGAGGGGGGASAVGANATSGVGGAGGAGSASSISGSSVTYAGGGGGSTNSGTTNGAGGAGGGGAGVIASTGVAGTTNTGGGGGASGQVTGGAGGSGTVIISYAGSQVFNGGLVTSSGGNTIHTFNATGALTPLTNNLNNSLRFRASASAYLSRTPTLATNRRTWTLSMWIKRGSNFGSQSEFFTAGTSGSNYLTFQFDTSNRLALVSETPSLVCELRTTSVYRDPAAWYHITLAVDTTQATSANRLKLYVNGNQVTAFATATYPTQNTDLLVNSAVAHYFSHNTSGGGYFDGYDTDINFIDGQALEPYYFGNNDANGVWKPILYKGTYGTNGFYLTFGNTTSTTTLGYDSSPNGNNWTTNNISLTAGTTYDAMLDVPTNTSATVSNYCVMNPLNAASTQVISFANLRIIDSTASAFVRAYSTFELPSSKIYFEATMTTAAPSNMIGVGTSGNLSKYPGEDANSWSYHSGGILYNNSTGTTVATATTAGDIVGVAVDMSAGKIWFSVNNTYIVSGNPSAGTNPAFSGLTGSLFPIVRAYSATMDINFGQRPFSYTPPTGFVALNTYNLPTPTILQGNKYMDATLYTGNLTGQSITNAAAFKPDLVWIKSRSAATDNKLTDSVRGATIALVSNSTAAETTDITGMTAFNSNGFTLGASTTYNNTGATYVGWQWQAGQGSTTTGTGTGGITSVTQSVNATAGFSIVTYTGSGSNGTVTHGLGVAPKWVIVKQRSAVRSWNAWHSAVLGTQFFTLETTDGVQTDATKWNSTIPTSSVISLGSAAGTNASAGTFVAYCWAEIAGFSKFGSYTGNGSADGPFVYTGFRPKWLLVKQSSSAGNAWQLLDSSRNTYNKADNALFPNTTGAETTGNATFDFLSNGFKVRTTDGTVNTSSSTYIYAAYAENPFKNSNAR